MLLTSPAQQQPEGNRGKSFSRCCRIPITIYNAAVQVIVCPILKPSKQTIHCHNAMNNVSPMDGLSEITKL